VCSLGINVLLEGVLLLHSDTLHDVSCVSCTHRRIGLASTSCGCCLCAKRRQLPLPTATMTPAGSCQLSLHIPSTHPFHTCHPCPPLLSLILASDPPASSAWQHAVARALGPAGLGQWAFQRTSRATGTDGRLGAILVAALGLSIGRWQQHPTDSVWLGGRLTMPRLTHQHGASRPSPGAPHAQAGRQATAHTLEACTCPEPARAECAGSGVRTPSAALSAAGSIAGREAPTSGAIKE
jgi:hypothetical protein